MYLFTTIVYDLKESPGVYDVGTFRYYYFLWNVWILFG